MCVLLLKINFKFIVITRPGRQKPSWATTCLQCMQRPFSFDTTSIDGHIIWSKHTISYPERFSESHNSMLNCAVEGSSFFGIKTQYGSDVDHHTAFLVVVLSHILDSQEQSADYTILKYNYN